MRIVIDNDSGIYNYSLYDTDGDCIINIEFEDDSTRASIRITDIFNNTAIREFERKELKQYLSLVLFSI